MSVNHVIQEHNLRVLYVGFVGAVIGKWSNWPKSQSIYSRM